MFWIWTAYCYLTEAIFFINGISSLRDPGSSSGYGRIQTCFIQAFSSPSYYYPMCQSLGSTACCPFPHGSIDSATHQILHRNLSQKTAQMGTLSLNFTLPMCIIQTPPLVLWWHWSQVVDQNQVLSCAQLVHQFQQCCQLLCKSQQCQLCSKYVLSLIYCSHFNIFFGSRPIKLCTQYRARAPWIQEGKAWHPINKNRDEW